MLIFIPFRRLASSGGPLPESFDTTPPVGYPFDF